MTIFENIAFGLRVRKWKNDAVRERVTELLRLIQLEGLEKRLPSQLSGGTAPASGSGARSGGQSANASAR
jgi:ABC-type sulfate/molybdate transport systems ATPase subunit